MRQKICFFIMFVMMAAMLLPGVKNFSLISKWKHKTGPITSVFFSFIDKDNNVIGAFYMVGPEIISSEKIIKFANRGSGPNEIQDLKAMFLYGKTGDIAIVEFPDKVKIFTKKDGTYVWKETKWLKRGPLSHIIRDGVFFDNKWFLAGVETLEETKFEMTVSLAKILDDKRQPLKQLFKRKYTEVNRFAEMNYYLAGYKTNLVFFLIENELKVSVISSKTLEVVKEVKLEIPSFYKKMPENFYVFKRNQSPKDFMVDIETWKMGYSQIAKVVVEGNYLVLQVRTCDKKLKNYALLFYNAETFKLERIIFTDDYLLGAKDGKYYCYANGNPGLDENTDECIINIYAFKEGK